MKRNCAAIGIDIGGTTTSFGFVDQHGIILAEAVIPTHGEQPAVNLVARLQQEIGIELCTLPDNLQLLGIGIGAPNANYLRGTVENPPNLKWGTSVNLVQLFRDQYNLPVAITNDANAAALGEMCFGGAQGMKDFIVITLGTGLGSGIVTDGKLLYGSDGFAGELGHTVVDPDGRLCACGKKGCLETYVSAPGLCRTALELLEQRKPGGRLAKIAGDKLTSMDVYEAAKDGDPLAQEAFSVTARILGIKLADAVAHTSPQAIFLSGGLANAGSLLIEPAKQAMEEYLFTPYKGKIPILPSALPSGNNAVLGAAALIWHKQKEPV